MIQSVHLKDFEAHIDSKLELCKGINTIVGASDQGKSSVLRGINLVLRNKPNGNNFVNHDALNASVELVTDTHIATRIKGKQNKYILDGTELTAFGQDVPEDIKQAMEFKDLNIQYQMDSAFLLSSSSGEVAKVFNKVVDLEKLDVILSNAEKKKRKHKNDYAGLRETVSTITNSISKYDWITNAGKETTRLSNLDSSIQESKGKTKLLEDLIETLFVHDTYLKKADDVLQYTDKFALVQQRYTSLKENTIKVETLNMLLLKVNNFTSKVDTYTDILKSSKDVVKLEKLVNSIKSNKWIYDGVFDLLGDFESYTDNIADIIDTLLQKEKEYQELMPSTCPFCGSNMKEDKCK